MSIKVTLNKKEITRLSIVINIITLIVILVLHYFRDFLNINFKQLGFFLIYYFLIYIPAHEIIHVLAAHMFKSGKAKFGFKIVHKVMPVAYVHIGGHYKISQLRLVYLMPLLALNLIPLCLFILDRNLLTFIYFSFFFQSYRCFRGPVYIL